MAIGTPVIGAPSENPSQASSAVPYPTVVGAGDGLILVGTIKATAATFTVPAGWTQVEQFGGNAGAAAPTMFVAVKANAAGTEGGTSLTVTHSTGGPSSFRIVAVPGANITTLLDVTATTWDNTGSTSVLPGVSVVNAGSMLIAIAAQNSSNSATPPPGFLELSDIVSGTAALEISYQSGVATGATGDKTVTWAGSVRSLGVLLAIRPAVAATSVPVAGAYTERTAETSTAVPYPTTVNAGDWMLLAASLTSASASSVTAPFGWTVIEQATGTGGTAQPHLFAAIKKATGTEGGTTLSVVHGSVVSAWQITALGGVDPTTPQDVTAVSVDQSVAGTATVNPGLTTVTDKVTLVNIAALTTSSVKATPPAGFTEIGDEVSGTRSFEISYKTGVAIGATGTVTVTWASSGKGLGLLIAFRPAPGGVITPPDTQYVWSRLVAGDWVDCEASIKVAGTWV